MTDTDPAPLRIATWNIRKALGTDRRRDPERVMRVIAGIGADAVLLQEADFRLPPRPPVLAADRLAEVTGLRAVRFDQGRESLGWHGNALLLRPGLDLVRTARHDLPGLEPRGMIEAVVATNSHTFRILGVHLGLLRASRRLQLSALNDLLPAVMDMPTLIAGDFNERSLRVGLGRLSPRFQILSGGPTWHSRRPLFALDRIAISPGFQAQSATALHTALTRRASDHLPLVADLTLLPRGQSIPGTT